MGSHHVGAVRLNNQFLRGSRPGVTFTVTELVILALAFLLTVLILNR